MTRPITRRPITLKFWWIQVMKCYTVVKAGTPPSAINLNRRLLPCKLSHQCIQLLRDHLANHFYKILWMISNLLNFDWQKLQIRCVHFHKTLQRIVFRQDYRWHLFRDSLTVPAPDVPSTVRESPVGLWFPPFSMHLSIIPFSTIWTSFQPTKFEFIRSRSLWWKVRWTLLRFVIRIGIIWPIRSCLVTNRCTFDDCLDNFLRPNIFLSCTGET